LKKLIDLITDLLVKAGYDPNAEMEQSSVADVLGKLLIDLVKGMSKMLPLNVFKLLTELSPVPCVDMIPCRRREGKWQLGFILRNTGFFTGKFWIIGGRINLGESIGEALDRNMRSDLMVGMKLFPGLSWFNPAFVSQYYHAPEDPSMPPLLDGSGLEKTQRDDFGHEPSKHCISQTYLVQLESEDVSFGSTAHGGQEASGFEWFDIDNLPPVEEVAYGGYDVTIMRAVRFLRNTRMAPDR
jgi:ADP-ribose pyrophosphatase YjhB (NUDIX family)